MKNLPHTHDNALSRKLAARSEANAQRIAAAPESYTVFDDEHPTIIVMHASAGSGHRSAARSVQRAFEVLREQGELPDDLRIEFLDVFSLGRTDIDGDATTTMFIGPTRAVYDLTWRYTFTGRLLWGGGTIWTRIMFPSLTEHFRQVKPIAVVATHITACNAAIGSRMLAGQDFPVVAVPTDYETEGLWPHRYTDLFCVASEQMAETLRARRVEKSRILITGIPARMEYNQHFNKAEERARWQLPKKKTVFLALAGAHLPKPYKFLRTTIDSALPGIAKMKKAHLVIVAGRDQEYATELRLRVSRLKMTNVTVLDYVDDMASLMAACDVGVMKAGGLTVTECLCAKLPMILVGRAYGQEKINVRTLTEAGAVRHVTTSRELKLAMKRLVKYPAMLRAMRVNGRYLRMPGAAIDIALATYALATSPDRDEKRRGKKIFMHFYLGKRPAHVR